MEMNSMIGDGGSAKMTFTSATENSAATNPNSEVSANSNADANLEAPDAVSHATAAASRQSSRIPFTNLNQVDADLALARTLQEQERAYMMLSMTGGEASYGRWDTGIYFHDDEDDDYGDSHDPECDEVGNEDDNDDHNEEDDDDHNVQHEDDIDNYDDDEGDAFDVLAHVHVDSRENNALGAELDLSAFPDDEAYARALQDAEEQEMVARLLAMAGLTEREIEDVEDQGGGSQDTWEEVDPDELSYEELLALGEAVGTESRGLSAALIASLPTTNYKAKASLEAGCDLCVICRLDYEDGDALITLPCKHVYHSHCINNWLKINKVCPVCSTEVSTSGNS